MEFNTISELGIDLFRIAKEEKGYRKGEMAFMLKVTRPTFNKFVNTCMERNDEAVDMRLLQKFADLLGVDITYLIKKHEQTETA